jgi:hypothetical protein
MCSVSASLGVTIGQVITRPTEHPPQMPPEADKLLKLLDLHVLIRTVRTVKLHHVND